MKHSGIREETVETVAAQVPGAKNVLRSHGIDATGRFSLAHATAMAGVEADQVLAELEIESRRISRRLTRERN